MDILEWVLQLKSHLSQLNLIQSLAITKNHAVELLNNTTILAAYLICFAITKNASRGYSLLAFFACMIISYSPLYDILHNTQYYGLFAIIYLRITYEIEPLTAKAAALLIGLFQITMVIDRIHNAGIETFIYANYEITICILHSLIIGSFIKSDFVRLERTIKRIICDCISIVRYASNRLLLCYHYK